MPQNGESQDFAGIADGYTPADSHTQSDDMQKLGANLQEWFVRSHEARSVYDRDWELYRLYLKGDQLVVRHKDTGEVVRLTAEDSKRLRSVNNVLRPTSRSLVGKLTRSIPTCTVLPATTDVEEQHAARAASAFLQFVRRKEDLDVKYLDVNNKLPWAGNAFMQVGWDYSAGADVTFCEICDFYDYGDELLGEECPQCSIQREQEMLLVQQQMQAQMAMAQEEYAATGVMPDAPPGPPQPEQLGPLPLGQEIPDLIEANEGDVKVHVRDPRDVFIDPGAESIEQAQMMCFREVVPVATARQRFPQFGGIIRSDDGIMTDRTAELRYNQIDSYGGSEELDDHCYVFEFHEAPTPMNREGRVIYMINDMVVDLAPSPYGMFRRFPFFHFGFDKNDGEFWREPFVAQAWHRQREINQIETQIREHVELLLRPKFFKAIGSRIATDELSATSAQVVSYNAAAGRNYFESPPPVPADIFRRNAQLASDIRMQAAITEQEAGISMSDPNGRAMAIIEAESDQQVGPILMRNNSEWREMHRCVLMLVQAYYHPERKFMTAGADGMQTYSFDEIRLEPGYDIQIEQEDGLSRNPAVRMTQALDLMNAGVFMDQQTGMPDLKAFMRHAKIKLPQAGYDSEASERAVASKIPYLIEKGQQFTPSVEDDPEIFGEELLGWLRGPGRRADPMLRDQVRQIWMFYIGWAMQGQPPAPVDGMPGGGGGGPDQSAPGGSANNPGRLGTDMSAGGDVAQNAQSQVSQADQAAEGVARTQQNHEG